VPGSPYTVASGINASGQVVGSYDFQVVGSYDFQYGFMLDNGTYTTLDVLGSPFTFASGINASGQIVGPYVDAGGIQHGFVLSDGSYTTLDVPAADGKPSDTSRVGPGK
jgi:probable HAF family extracellular repeat protein